ncbi:MAG: rhodanese-like domain-containing protein [Ilumatobacteraceae bacterium]
MIFEQHYLDCLSQASYLIADEGTRRAVVVDPRRDITPYLETAEERGLSIELVIETHFHADFLSGHLELAAATGAAIGYGSAADTEFESQPLGDGERIVLGDVVLEIRHTPGHTPESISIVVFEHADDEVPYGVLTGDTLFVGDVGRPDLLSSRGVTSDELASDLFDSLHGKLMTLPDPTRVFPGHGAGSSCGKNLSTETSSTIGDQRRSNYAVQTMSKEAFVDVVTEGQSAPPAYFSYDANLNREQREIFDDSPPPPLPLDEVVLMQRTGVVVLDARDPNEYAVGHLLGSINVGLAGRYAEYAGGVIQPGARIVLVTDPGMETEAKIRLARIGYDNVVGHLATPLLEFETNPADVGHGARLDAAELAGLLVTDEDVQLVDVRQPGELAEGVIDGAVEIPLTRLNERLATLDASKRTIVYCAGGYRSSIAASRLRAAGFADVSDLLGGYGAWTAAQPVG